MKFAIRLIITSITAYVLSLFMPWWSVAIAGFLAVLIIPGKGIHGFMSAFSGVALLWIFLVWQLDQTNGSVMSARIIELLPLSSLYQVVLLTATIGGLVSGFAAVAGSSLGGVLGLQKN